MDQPGDFKVGKVFRQSWKNIKGMKFKTWVISIIIAALSWFISWIVMLIFGFSSHEAVLHNKPLSFYIAQMVTALVIALVIAPFQTTYLMLGIRRARGETPGFAEIGRYLPQWPQLAITYFLMLIPITIFTTAMNGLFDGRPLTVGHIIGGVVCLLIYMFLVLRWLFTLVFAADHQMPLQAITSSWHLTAGSRWPKMFLTFLLIGIIVAVAFIPLLIIDVIIFALGARLPTQGVASHAAQAATAASPGAEIAIILISLAYGIIVLTWLLPWVMLTIGEIFHQLHDKPSSIKEQNELSAQP